MSQEAGGSSVPPSRMAVDFGNSSDSAQKVDLCAKALKLVAVLQVKIGVLSRAQAMAPQLADQLQVEIDEIERRLRAFEPNSPPR